MNINKLFLPLEVLEIIFKRIDIPCTLACTCKDLYQIFSEISFNAYLTNDTLKERAERIQQQYVSAPYYKKILKLFKSLILDINDTKDNYSVKEDTFSACYEALLSARYPALNNDEKLDKHISAWKKRNLVENKLNPSFLFDPQRDVPSPSWPIKQDLSESDIQLMMSGIHQSAKRLAELERWLEDTNLIKLFENIIKKISVPFDLSTGNDIHTNAQNIREWLTLNENQLNSIKSLYIPANTLTSLPKEIRMLKKLNWLDLKNNRLTSLPKEIGKLENLDDLDLSNNRLTSLPKEIAKLENLEILNLSRNHLTSLEEIEMLDNLKGLDINDNNLTCLPKRIMRVFKDYDSLDLANNRLTSLPEEIGQCTRLKVLDLEDNDLTSLPKEIGQLTQLDELYVGYNRLSSLPKEIGQMTCLDTLELQDNQLTSLPKEIKQLKMLTRLRIHHNPLDLLDISIYDELDDENLDPEDLLQHQPFLSIDELKKAESSLIASLSTKMNKDQISKVIELFHIQKQHLLEINRLMQSKTLSSEQIEQLRKNYIRLMEELTPWHEFNFFNYDLSEDWAQAKNLSRDLTSCYKILDNLKKL